MDRRFWGNTTRQQAVRRSARVCRQVDGDPPRNKQRDRQADGLPGRILLSQRTPRLKYAAQQPSHVLLIPNVPQPYLQEVACSFQSITLFAEFSCHCSAMWRACARVVNLRRCDRYLRHPLSRWKIATPVTEIVRQRRRCAAAQRPAAGWSHVAMVRIWSEVV